MVKNTVTNLRNGVSLVIPFYNAGQYAFDLAKSISAQTRKPNQIIIVDDGNGRGIEELKNAFKKNDLIFEIYTSKGKIGPGASRNLGFLHVKYRYVCFLDSDDKFEKQAISSQLNSIKLNKCFAVCLSCYYFNDSGILNYNVLPKKISYIDLLHTNPLCPSVILFDVSKIENIRFDNKGHEDYRLWLKISKKYGDFICSKNIFVGIRRSLGSVSSNKFRAASWHWKALSDVNKLPFTFRCIFFVMYIINALCKRICKTYKPLYLSAGYLKKLDL